MNGCDDMQIMAYEYGTLETDSDDTVTSSALADNGEYDRVEFKYYADGSPRERKDQAGTTHEYVYDYIGRLTADKVTATGTGIDDAVLCIEREYDDHGRLERITSLDAATSGTVVNEVVYTFDGWGNVSKSQQDHSTTVSGSSPDVDYAYEDGNPGGAASYVRLDYVTYPNGDNVYYNYQTDAIGAALSRLGNIASSGSPNDSDKYVEYTYYGVSGILKIDYPAVTDGLKLDYGVTGGYGSFDRFGRIEDQHWTDDSSTTIRRHQYGYGRTSSRTWREDDQAGKDDWFTYDDLDRLETWQRGDLTGTPYSGVTNKAKGEAWTLEQTGAWRSYNVDADGDGSYDDAGDLDQNREHNDANEITGITEDFGPAWADPVYDEAGNMTAGPKAGTVANGATRLFHVYDAWGRMVQAWEDDGDGTLETEGEEADTQIAAYEYDGLHRRIKKTVDEVDYDFYYNTSWQILEIHEGGDTTYPEKQYIWGVNYIDAPVCRFRDDDTDGNAVETVYYMYDANFNVVGLYSAGGAVLERYMYDPYGTPYNAAGGALTAYDNEIFFCGYRFDPETGLYHVRMRYLNPRFGWITRDPKDQNLPGGGYHDGMSLYEYCMSGPANGIDPQGLGDGKFDDFWDYWVVPAAEAIADAPGEIAEGVVGGAGVIGEGAGYVVEAAADAIKESAREGWRQVIKRVLHPKGWKVAAMFLEHSLQDNPEDLTLSEDHFANKKMRNSPEYKKLLKEIINAAPLGEFGPKETSIRWSKGDLFAAIHKASVKYEGCKSNSNKWWVNIEISDKYDFHLLADDYFKKDIEKVLATIANNMAWSDQFFGVINNYKWTAKMEEKSE